MDKEFTMSMYANSEDLHKAKAEYYQKKYEGIKANQDSRLTFIDSIKLAKGCFDYSGGYHDKKEHEIYHHGIHTVISVLEAADKTGINSVQLKALHNIGSNAS